MRFLLQTIIGAIAIWVSTLLFDGVTVVPHGRGALNDAIVFLVIGLIFALVNAIIKPIIKALAWPIYVLTLGLFTFVVNALLLMLTSWLTGFTSFGLNVADFWTAVWASIVISICSWVLNLLFGRPDRK